MSRGTGLRTVTTAMGGRTRGGRSPAAVAAAILSATVLAVVTMAGCSLGTLLGSTVDTTPIDEVHDWTIVVYMCSDNELEGEALIDLNEMEAFEPGDSDINVIAIVDRAVGHDTTEGNWTGTRIFRIDHDPDGVNQQLISPSISCPPLGIDGHSDVEIDLTNPITLSTLLQFTADRFPARHRALIVWGQGSGWRSVGYDSSSNDSFFTPELAQALAGNGIDVVALDTSFGATIELAYELRGAGGMLIASQDQVANPGWRYDRFLAALRDGDGSIAAFSDAAHASYRAEYGSHSAATISTIDLSRIDEVATALNEMAGSVVATTDVDRRLIRDAYFYDVEDFYATPGDLFVDLYDLADVTHTALVPALGGSEELEAAADQLRLSVERAVTASWTNAANPRAHGLSVHLIPLLANGAAASIHDDAYICGRPVEHPLAFVSDSEWVPNLDETTGLLYLLFYAPM